MLLLLAAGAPLVFSQDGHEITLQAEEKLRADAVYSVSEITVTRAGRARPTMEIETYFQHRKGIDHTLAVYRNPPRMVGTAYLMVGGDLWVRFGATGRVRKLRSAARAGSAGGTDFSYEDFGAGGEGLTAKYEIFLEQGDTVIDGVPCHRLLYTPKPGVETGYEKLLVFIAKESLSYQQIRYFQDNANIKTLRFSEYRSYGHRSYPVRIAMESHVRTSTTEMVTLHIEFDSPRVTENLFSPAYLEQLE